MGEEVISIPTREMEKGSGNFMVYCHGIPTGIYLGIFKSNNDFRTIRFIIAGF
jgi:hypothetical protein